MAFEIDASAFDTEDQAREGGRMQPGTYHVRVTGWDDSFERFDKIVATFDILAGTTPEQEGRQHIEYFAVSEKAMPRLVMVTIAAGAIKPGEVKDVQPGDMLGRELFIVLDKQKAKDGKVYTNITWDGFYSMDHPDMASVPQLIESMPRAEAEQSEPVVEEDDLSDL